MKNGLFYVIFSINFFNASLAAQPKYYPNLLDKKATGLTGPIRNYDAITSQLFPLIFFLENNTSRCFDTIPHGLYPIQESQQKKPSELYYLLSLSKYGLLTEIHRELMCRIRTAKNEYERTNTLFSSNPKIKKRLLQSKIGNIAGGICLATIPFIPSTYFPFAIGLSYILTQKDQQLSDLYKRKKMIGECINNLQKAKESPVLHSFLKTRNVARRDTYYALEKQLICNANLNNTINGYLGLPIRLTNEPHAGKVYEHLDFSSCGLPLDYFLTNAEKQTYIANNGWIPLSNHTYMFEQES